MIKAGGIKAMDLGIPLTKYKLNYRSILLLFAIPFLFAINLFLIGKGDLFTGYRNMLFYYNYQDLNLLFPFIVFILLFPISIILLHILSEKNTSTLDTIKNPSAFVFLIVVAIISVSQIFFLNIPETNPDFKRYFIYAQIFKEHGLLYYFTEWGNAFPTHVDLPTSSLPFGILFTIFGPNRLVIQIFSIIIVIITAYVIFLLGSKIKSQKCGIISSVIFVSFPFLLTQIPLFLMDIISTFYITLFAFFSYIYLERGSISFLLISGMIFFLAIFSKGLAPLFLVGILLGFLIITILKNANNQPYLRLTMLNAMCIAPSLLYFIYLSPTFSGLVQSMVRQNYSFPLNWTIIFVGILIFSLIFIIMPLLVAFPFKNFFNFVFKVTNFPFKILAILLLYFIIFGLMSINLWKSYFYLRSLPIALGILPALLALISISCIIWKKELAAIPLILWFLIPVIFMPNTMYKYLQPAYPAIALMCGLCISWIKDEMIQKSIIAGIITSGLIIALCIFYPMCMTHSQINLKNGVEYIEDSLQSNQNQGFRLIYIPTTERFIERIDLFIKHIPIWLDYYSTSQMRYNLSVIQSPLEYQDIINDCVNENAMYIMIISDCSEVNESVLLPSILENYSVMKVYNHGYHAAYWWNTQQVIILKNNQVIVT